MRQRSRPQQKTPASSVRSALSLGRRQMPSELGDIDTGLDLRFDDACPPRVIANAGVEDPLDSGFFLETAVPGTCCSTMCKRDGSLASRIS
jgi:hypothetical protein